MCGIFMKLVIGKHHGQVVDYAEQLHFAYSKCWADRSAIASG